jgi:hypothetical protein
VTSPPGPSDRGEPNPPPTRVRVTGPRSPRVRPLRSAGSSEIARRTRVGEVYVSSLLRDQLALAIRILLTLALCLGPLPLLFHLAPGLAEVRLAGFPVTWLVLGVLVYPFLLLLGWAYVRRAERIEQAFAELLREAEE